VSVMVIDVGNTSTGIGLIQAQKVLNAVHVKGGLKEDSSRCERIVADICREGCLDGVVLGSVVPSVNKRWKSLIAEYIDAPLLEVNASLPMQITIDYPEPATIGADRLADACGGACRYGAPLIVADFGTALTFDVVLPDMRYVGGVITPGLPFMTDYLGERTELLPKIRLQGECPAVGRSTEEAMRIGAEVGYRGIVKEIVVYLRKSLGADFKLVATGGYADWALRGMEMDFVIDAELTLYGLACIFYSSREG
jgi:type III pantothenate kinase